RFDLDAAVAAIDDAVDELTLRADADPQRAARARVVVVGLSLGGYVGIRYAAQRPDRVAGLLAASCTTDPRTVVTDAWRLAARVIGRLPDRGARLNRTLVDLTLPTDGARDV